MHALGLKGCLTLAAWICTLPLYAHEHWILLRAPGSDGKATVAIASGHSFPDSEMLLSEKVLYAASVTAPDGVTAPLALSPADQRWVGTVDLDRGGVWMASFELRRPRQKTSVYHGRSLLIAVTDNPEQYVLNQGLEIRPGSMLSALTPGDTFPLFLLMDGEPVAGRIAITPEAGVTSYLSTSRDRPAMLLIRRPGAYLLTATKGGVTFSLTFSVAPEAHKEPE